MFLMPPTWLNAYNNPENWVMAIDMGGDIGIIVYGFGICRSSNRRKAVSC
jgi:hypothetical protein